MAKKGSVYQNHFAHETSSTACEGALHIIAKRLLAERIQRAINTQSTVPAHWECTAGTTHEGDLLALSEVDAASSERWWPQKGIQPDVTLSQNGQPTMLLEVVVTHRPDYDTSRVGIPILEVHLEDRFDLENLASGVVPFARTHNLECGCSRSFNSKESESCMRCGRMTRSDHLHYSDYLREHPLCRACLPSPREMIHACTACGASFEAQRHDHDLCRDCWRIQSQREEFELRHCRRCQKKLASPEFTYCFPCNQNIREEARQRAQQEQAEKQAQLAARQREAEEELEREGEWLNALVTRTRKTGDLSRSRTTKPNEP